MSFFTHFARGSAGVFSTATLSGHLVRGAVAFALLAWAMQTQADHPMGALLAGVGALIAFRGCPICWTVGLFETLVQKFRGGPA